MGWSRSAIQGGDPVTRQITIDAAHAVVMPIDAARSIRTALGETPIIVVTIDNGYGQWTSSISDPPVGADATIDLHGKTWSGIVRTVRLGQTITVEVET